ncbi:uncharacterized protein L201_000052 [Kwoniella dendrophila CBS 6074]|uniref:Enoyl reductase (ER) domain-containing protein n=1 Tax=Kwoniella dendrophila CBS 6074 TaxID=1295534 RepID=A0AAX4JJX2_9TREE
MSVSIPKTMKAVVEDEKANWANVKEINVPQPGDNEVLVKVAYAAQNAGDWKLASFISTEDSILGCDYSGTIVKLGKNLRSDSLKVGDRIAGTILGGMRKDRGSFAEYLVVESDLTFKVPGNISLEDASTFGVSWLTAGQVINQTQNHPLTQYNNSKTDKQDKWYTIYGGSTSVGLFAIQLAKSLRYKVLTFTSPHSFDLVKSYGADQVINYCDPNAIEQALTITNGGSDFVFDTISHENSFNISLGSLGNGNGEVHTVVYTLLGQEMNFSPRTPDQPTIIPAIPSDREFGVGFFEKTAESITKFDIKANPLDIRQGLESVPKGLENQRDGKVSGKKIVYKIA